jgi:hypothetical protein
MNHAPSNQTPASIAPGPVALAGLILIAALTRLLPHPPNFSPVEAIALFGGAYFASRAWAVLVPVAGMFVSDLVLGAVNGGTYFDYFSTASFWVVYACIVLTALMGFGLRGKVNGARVLGYSLAGSVLFFVLSNFGVWLTAQMVPGYPACTTGLIPCYAAAVPFFQWTVLGTLFYSALLFGGFALLRRHVPALRAQTV